LKYIFSGSITKDELDKRIKLVTKHFDTSLKKIASIGARKIKNGMIVYTHCHSSTVTAILKEAKAQGKRFEVHNTETRPKYQGRITAAEIAKAGIPVTHYVDSAAKIALEKADIMMIGLAR
jgi:ribose 1,5-bisphosphate isomerase